MKKRFSALIYLFCFAILSFGSTICREDAVVKKMAEELNAKCPMQLDFLVKLDKVDFKAPKTIVYHHTINLTNSLDTEFLDALKENIKINSGYSIINKDDYKAVKEAGATFTFIYKTQEGEPFLEYEFKPSFYEKESLQFTDEEFEKFLQQSATVLSSQFPQEVFEGINCDSVQYIAPHTLNFVYSFVNLSKDDFEDELIEYLKTDLTASFVEAKEDDRLLKDNNTNFRFSYFDNEGIFIFSLYITPEEYQ